MPRDWEDDRAGITHPYVHQPHTTLTLAHVPRFSRTATRHTAAFHGDVEMLEYLQGENADCCQAQDRIGRKATTHAALNGQVEALTYLIDHCNIDINSVDFYGGNALHWAAAHGRKAVVEMLVRKGIDVNGTVENGRTAASIAENQNKNQCALWLQKWMERLKGLMKAAVGGDLEAIKVRARGVRMRGRIRVCDVSVSVSMPLSLSVCICVDEEVGGN